MKRAFAVVQARVGSSRLPGKVLLPLAGAPALQRMIERVALARELDGIVVATTTDARDDEVALLAESIHIPCIRGSEEDVLSRYALAAQAVETADYIVRLTGDCPLIDPAVIDEVVRVARDSGADYASNIQPPSWPDGLDVEVISRSSLLEASIRATAATDREHVTPWIVRTVPRERAANVVSTVDHSGHRWTLDEPEDYVLIAAVYAGLYDRDHHFGMNDILGYLEARPEISSINARFIRNSGYLQSLHAIRTEGGGA